MIRLVELADLERSLGGDHAELDEALALWAIETVSAVALQVTGQSWQDALDVPPGAMAILGLATRRLYTNPDRFTRENESDYGYALDATVTKADVFTPSELASLREFSVRPSAPKGLGTIGTYRGDECGGNIRFVPDGSEYGFPWYEKGWF